MSRISLHQAHIELNNDILDVTIPFTNELSDSIILVLKLNTNFRNNSLKDGMFNFTNISEALNLVKKLKSKSSTGYDNISNILIKHAKTILAKPLTLLADQIIHTGEFSRQLKIARVKPLYKKGDQSSFSSYRPISLLPSI